MFMSPQNNRIFRIRHPLVKHSDIVETIMSGTKDTHFIIV